MSASGHFVSSWQDFHTCSCLPRCIKAPFFRKKLCSGERSIWSFKKDIWKATKETLLSVFLIKCLTLPLLPCLLRKRQHDSELGRISNLVVCETVTPLTDKLILLLKRQQKSLFHLNPWGALKIFRLMCFVAFVTNLESVFWLNLLRKTKRRFFLTSQIIYLAHIILHLFSKDSLLMQKTSILSQRQLYKSQVTITTKYAFSIQEHSSQCGHTFERLSTLCIHLPAFISTTSLETR